MANGSNAGGRPWIRAAPLCSAASPTPANTRRLYLRKFGMTYRSIYLTRIHTRFAQERAGKMTLSHAHLYPKGRFLVPRKDMFPKDLSAEAGETLAHDVDHGLGGPAVPAIV